MRTFLVVLALVATGATATASPYGKTDAKQAHPAATTASTTKPAAASPAHPALVPLDNIVRVAPDGTRTALCCCGQEFTVADDSPTLARDGTTFFMCSNACKAAAVAATPQEAAKTMSAWHAKFAKESLATNAVVKDGRTTAVCGCGKEFTVTDRSPVIEENGTKLYCCSEACHEHLMKLSASERMAIETRTAGQGRTAVAGM